MDFSGVEKAGASFEEVAKKYKLTPEQIARYQVRNMTGEAYFKTLGMEEQRKVLGPAKWLAWKEGKFEFGDIVKSTFSPTWGEGKGVASLADLMEEKDANYYLRLVQNGLAKQNLNADELIKFASLDLRPLTNKEVGKIVEKAATGFDNSVIQRSRGLVGFNWNGRELNAKDDLPIGEYHFVKHVLKQGEWPAETSISDYYRSIEEIVRSNNSQIIVSRYDRYLQVSFIGDSGKWQGSNGSGKIVVEYRVGLNSIITAFQPKDVEEFIKNSNRDNLIWIRK